MWYSVNATCYSSYLSDKLSLVVNLVWIELSAFQVVAKRANSPFFRGAFGLFSIEIGKMEMNKIISTVDDLTMPCKGFPRLAPKMTI